MHDAPPRRRLFSPESPTHLQPLGSPSGLPAPNEGALPASAPCWDPDPADAPHTPGEAYPEVASWAASLPAGAIGTAAELLPLFLAAGAPSLTRYGAPWSARVLGIALARLRDRVVAGRFLRRYRTRGGVNVWEVVATALIVETPRG